MNSLYKSNEIFVSHTAGHSNEKMAREPERIAAGKTYGKKISVIVKLKRGRTGHTYRFEVGPQSARVWRADTEARERHGREYVIVMQER